MEKLILPRLAGTREAVDDLLAEQQLPEELVGERLAVLCADLASGSSSFADQLVLEVLVNRGADELVLVGAPERFVQYVRAAAKRRGVAGRVAERSGAELEV
ncbi:MAG: hypothetical protein M3P96_02960 [Actinomycetota bacterium]|nr:hypothetical protein [Actinomycetota bacterium]